MGWLLAVHVGAGRYGESAESQAQYEALLRDALAEGRRLMTQYAASDEKPTMNGMDMNSDTTMTAAAGVASGVLRVLEHNARTNCGRGSNLTEAGVVECEASVACGRTRRVAACAAVRGVAEPSALALRLLANAACSEGNGVGREPPLVVVGNGATALARAWGLNTLPTDADEETRRAYQVTEAARRQWRKWHTVMEGGHTKTEEEEEEERRLDTVGAVCVDLEGNTAAALSSGGVLYKVPGRVGLAGCPRMGCDARNAREKAAYAGDGGRKRKRTRWREDKQSYGFAVASTGRGEHFIRSALVPAIGVRLRSGEDVDGVVRECFEEAREDNGGVAVEGGVLVLSISPLVETKKEKKRRRRQDEDKSKKVKEEDEDEGQRQGQSNTTRHVQLAAALTTPCMGVGYLLDSFQEPRVQILRNQSGQLMTHTSFFRV